MALASRCGDYGTNTQRERHNNSMSDQTRMYWIHALTPLHVGAGRGVGYIDLPILREKVTNLPLVPGSAIKGVLGDTHDAEMIRQKMKRREALNAVEDAVLKAFGIAGDEHSNSGSLVFTDAHLVCLPVRSIYGTFAWCTSPLILKRLHRDLKAAGLASKLKAPNSLRSETSIHVPQDTASSLHDSNKRVFLEDLDLTAEPCPTASAWASELGTWLFGKDSDWSITFRERFAVVPDNVFNFLSETGTEVIARVRIDDEQKTVAKGALWYEESLPAESILAGLVWCDRVFGSKNNGLSPITESALLDQFCPPDADNSILQIGGKATVGKGRVRCVFTSGSKIGGQS